MIVLKGFLLIGIFLISTVLGVGISKKYQTRVKELKELLTALNMFEEKIKFTYEPIPDVFFEISQNTSKSIWKI